MQRSIVLLSGGMDSATALFAAGKMSNVVAIMFFDYGQRGAEHERECSKRLACDVKSWNAIAHAPLPTFIETSIQLPVHSRLLVNYGPCPDPDAKDGHGMPATFVPARNYIFIAHAASVAYTGEADVIFGGWSSVDVDYPDCREGFLHTAAAAASLALGRTTVPMGLDVRSPVMGMSKAQIVSMGSRLGVPWELTRSCYSEFEHPCLECDSCLKRIAAFAKSGYRDPLVKDDGLWDSIVEKFAPGVYITQAHETLRRFRTHYAGEPTPNIKGGRR